jgi:hypothetical protein
MITAAYLYTPRSITYLAISYRPTLTLFLKILPKTLRLPIPVTVLCLYSYGQFHSNRTLRLPIPVTVLCLYSYGQFHSNKTRRLYKLQVQNATLRWKKQACPKPRNQMQSALRSDRCYRSLAHSVGPRAGLGMTTQTEHSSLPEITQRSYGTSA